MTKLLDMVPYTFQTYEDFCSKASFYALCKVSDITLYARPDLCGEAKLAAYGLSFPVTIFG